MWFTKILYSHILFFYTDHVEMLVSRVLSRLNRHDKSGKFCSFGKYERLRVQMVSRVPGDFIIHSMSSTSDSRSVN